MLDGLDAQVRPYQLRITGKAMRMFAGRTIGHDGQPEKPCHAVMIESPTGSGKTIMGLTIARFLQQEYGYSIGWVAMRRNLLAQAEEENQRRGFGVTMTTISMFDKHPPAVDVLIVDEAQHDAAMSMANIHCSVEPKHVLGLTADAVSVGSDSPLLRQSHSRRGNSVADSRWLSGRISSLYDSRLVAWHRGQFLSRRAKPLGKIADLLS